MHEVFIYFFFVKIRIHPGDNFSEMSNSVLNQMKRRENNCRLLIFRAKRVNVNTAIRRSCGLLISRVI